MYWLSQWKGDKEILYSNKEYNERNRAKKKKSRELMDFLYKIISLPAWLIRGTFDIIVNYLN